MKFKQEIKILTLAIDEGDDTIHYQLEVSNGITSTTQLFTKFKLIDIIAE